jgi:uncharacterized protein YdhG (YjbR/CyaY superfamily)
MKTYKSIDSYIKSAPKSVQPALRKLRATVRKAAPKATEAISYGMPTLKLNGNLVHFAAFKKHLSFFPGRSGIQAFIKGAAKYQTGKGTLQFPLGESVPYGLVARITRFRAKENLKRKKRAY